MARTALITRVCKACLLNIAYGLTFPALSLDHAASTCIAVRCGDAQHTLLDDPHTSGFFQQACVAHECGWTGYWRQKYGIRAIRSNNGVHSTMHLTD
jgi:hypothetical protein